MSRIPRPEVQCPNCGASMLGRPCAVCGYRSQKQAVYPIGHDRLTDSYSVEEADHEHEWWDADDDETAWHCRVCGLTEYPGDPGVGA